MDDFKNQGSNYNNSLEDSYRRVSFEGDWHGGSVSSDVYIPKMVERVIKHSGGFIKNKEQAYYFLWGFVVISFMIILFIIFGKGDSVNEIKILPAEF